MDKPTTNTRIVGLGAFFGLVLLTLVVRLWALQVANWGPYTKQAQKNRFTEISGPAPRGLILDCNGEVLVDNCYAWHVEVIPKDLPAREDDLEKEVAILAGILGETSAAELREHFEKIKSTQMQAVPLPGGEDVPFRVVAQIEERAPELPGVRIAECAHRHYPHASLAAHVLGYARSISSIAKEQADIYRSVPYPDDALNGPSQLPKPEGIEAMPIYGNDSIVGQTGVEQLCELDTNTAPAVPILQGRRSRTVYEVDRLNNPVRVAYQEEAAPGATVYLTIDTRVQKVAEAALANAIKTTTGKTGGAVCLDLETGGVVAMASYPTFDPNGWVRGWSDEEFKAFNDDPRKPLFNKVIGGQYAPASTFKIVSATAAMETTQIKTTTTYFCRGIIHEGTKHQPFKCWQRKGHGRVDFYRAIAESCDVYFYEMVRKSGLTSSAIANHARLFGFGEPTGLGLTGSACGLVPTKQYKRSNTGEDWRSGDTLNMVIGQGYLSATPLQVAIATAVVASDGEVIEPTVVRKIAWPHHMHREPTTCERKVRRHLELKPDTLATVRAGMRRAVTYRNGTARLLDALPFSCAAKTGSAEHDKRLPTHAWITTFAPYSNPRFVVTVLVSEGGYGSSTAGPVARDILATAMAAQDKPANNQ